MNFAKFFFQINTKTFGASFGKDVVPIPGQGVSPVQNKSNEKPM